MRRLRAECAWKAAQTHRSLARFLLEEVHETLEALDLGDTDLLREELGDLLLQVLFHAAIAEQAGDFTLDDVASDLAAKLVRRNPHVFAPDSDPAGAPVDPAQVNELWESVKATEKQRTSLTDGLPPGLPALLHADKVLDRLSRRDGVAVGDLADQHTERPVLLLVASPFLGPATWQPVGWWLRGRGHDVVVAERARTPLTPQAVVDAVVAAAPVGRPVVLVVHSNAGLYAPHLSTLLDVRGVVYVDAALAGDEDETPLAPPSLLEDLMTRADDDGMLPGWTDWWPSTASDRLFPDPATRAGVQAEQQPVPVGYLRSRVPVPARWRGAPAAYLAFGGTYAAEVAQARAAGWPVETLPGEHLHTLVAPRSVGESVERLVGLLRDGRRQPSVDLGARLLGLVARAHQAGVDPEQALREATRRLLEAHGSGTGRGGA